MAANDVTPPQLTSLTFPGTIDASTYESGLGVSHQLFTAGASDSGTGVDHVTITLDRPRFGSGGGDTITIGNAQSLFVEGPQSVSGYFGPNSPAGAYTIKTVAVYDHAGNVATYSSAQLSALGIATSFNVISPQAADNTPPTLTSLTLPTTADVTQGTAYFTLAANARDTGTGPSVVKLTIDHGVGTQALYANGASLTGTLTLGSTAAPGTYHVTAATVIDSAGNAQSYTGGQLGAMQIQTSFVVKSNTPADTTAPVLTALSVPTTIDLTGGNNLAVPITANITETGTGLAQIALTLDHSVNILLPSLYYGYGTPLGASAITDTIYGGTADPSYSGPALPLTQTGDTYSFTNQVDYNPHAGVPLSGATSDGTYHVTGVTLTDNAGNVSHYNVDQLATLGANTTIQINADGSTPTLTGFNISPGLTTLGGPLKITATATDTGAGVTDVIVHTSYPGGYSYYGGYDANHLDLQLSQGSAIYDQTVPSESRTGTYDIYDVIVKDGGGNSTYYSADQLHAMGFATSFAVTSGRSTGDFDGNGLSDLLWRNTNGAISTWSTDVGGAHQRITQDTFDANVEASWHPIETFDWNGDRHGDILWRNDNGGVAIWTGKTGDFSQSAYLDFSVDKSWQVAAAGDINGDQHEDLLWRNSDGSLSTWITQGNGFAKDVYHHAPVDESWQVEGLGDFNGDGKSDILWRNTDGAVAVWNSTGTGFQESSVLHDPVDRAWHIVGIGDFDGDGRDDVLWRNDNGQVTVWQGNGKANGFDEVRFNASAATDWHVAAVGDYSGDHRADILWRNDAGAVSIWNSDGSGWQQNTFYDASVGNQWSIVSHHFGL